MKSIEDQLDFVSQEFRHGFDVSFGKVGRNGFDVRLNAS
jgi:hypothetical protein